MRVWESKRIEQKSAHELSRNLLKKIDERELRITELAVDMKPRHAEHFQKEDNDEASEHIAKDKKLWAQQL